jgi:serine/threonine protein kinase/tetratricopeptide (TPR) repeat protein
MTDSHLNLRRLFGEALDLPAAERAAFLAGACGDDRALAQRLQAMLAAADDERFLADPAAAWPAPAPAAAAASDAAAEGPGTWIGPYKLLQQIGEGGFGVVFLAEQRQPVARRVALKVVKLGMDTKQVVARFEQERQALALMDHAHIARVLDAGATALGRPYFVMDLVEGAPIVDYCDTNNLTIDERLEVFTQVCSAVQHAHGKGVIHRDLKPSNVLVATKDGRPQAKVIDFGIAKATSQRLTDKTLFTEHRQVIGTLQYMSPEQAVGSPDIDTRTDVYSLGILLYELLAGSTPFDKQTLQDAMLGEIQRIIRDVAPPRPSTRLGSSRESLASIAAHRRIEPRRLGMLLRGELDWIVMKALEKDRTRRYETAAGLAQDVHRYLAGFEVSAAPPSVGYRLRTFVRRNRAVVAACAAVVVALLLGVAGFAWQASVTAEERDRAVSLQQSEASAKLLAQQNEQKAVEQALRAELAQQEEAKARARAETISEFVATALMAGDAVNEGGGQGTTILAAMDRAIADIDTGRFAADPETEASLRSTIATILRNNGRVESAHELATAALAIRRRLYAGDHAAVASSLCDVGMALDACGRKAEAEACFVQSLEMYERLHPGDDQHVAALLNNVGELRCDIGRQDEAEPLLVRAVEMQRRLAPDGNPALAKSLDNLAQVRGRQGRHDEAEELYLQALELRRQIYRGDHPDLAVGLNNLATALVHVQRVEAAEPLFAEALAIRQRWRRG